MRQHFEEHDLANDGTAERDRVSPGHRTRTQSLMRRGQVPVPARAPLQAKTDPAHVAPETSALLDLAMRPDLGPTTSAGLPAPVRAQMERFYGHDFGAVQVHADSAEATRLGARAYARGDEVHFAPGEFAPTTTAGQELIGHELAHVVQQREGRVAAVAQGQGLAVAVDPALEREADDLGARAARGEPPRGPWIGASAALAAGAAQAKFSRRIEDRTSGKLVVRHEPLDDRAIPSWVIHELDGEVALRGGDREQARRLFEQWRTDDEHHKVGDDWFDDVIIPIAVQCGGERPLKRRMVEDEEDRPHKRLDSEELKALGELPSYGHEDFGGQKDDVAFGQTDRELFQSACYNFALSGGTEQVVRPDPLFNMLGFGLDTKFEDNLPEKFSGEPERRFYQAPKTKEKVEQLRKRLRGCARKQKKVKQQTYAEVREEALKLMVEANGMEVAKPEDKSPFSVSLESSDNPTAIDWTHWGINVNGQSFETNPNIGVWHSKTSFEDNWKGSGLVTTVPVKSLTPRHEDHLRSFTAMHRGGWHDAADLQEVPVKVSDLERYFSSGVATAITKGKASDVFTDKEGRAWQLVTDRDDPLVFRRRHDFD